jgi:hypothetical protein
LVLKRLYAVLAAAVVALGCLHMATTFRLSSATPSGKVWFFGSGIAMALAGVLNLLNRRYGLAAPGLRAACIATNLVVAVFAGVAGFLTGAGSLERLIMMALLVSVLVLSALGSASLSSCQP